MKDLNLILKGNSEFTVILPEPLHNISQAFLKSVHIIDPPSQSIFICIDEIQNTNTNTLLPGVDEYVIGSARRAFSVIHDGEFINNGYNHTVSTFPAKTISKLHVSFYQNDGVTPASLTSTDNSIMSIHLE